MKIKLTVIVLMTLTLGCSSQEEPKAAAAGKSDQVAGAADAIPINSTVPGGLRGTSVNAAAITLDTPPEIVCQAFIDYLKQGDGNNAEKLMSQDSIAQTRQHQLALAMPGGQDATYNIGEPSFATNEKKVAFVPVTPIEAQTGDASTQPFSLLLKKGKFGWKIVGISLPADDQSQELYSFENPLDVLKIKSLIDGEIRQARATENGELNRLE